MNEKNPLRNEYAVTSTLSLDREGGQVSPLGAESMSLIIRFPAGIAEE